MVRGVSLAYGAYLLLPIVLLVIGSFGQNWTNTLLPNGATGQWYAELWHDAAFRRAFSTSLMVALAACAINAVLATPWPTHCIVASAPAARSPAASSPPCQWRCRRSRWVSAI